MAGRESLDAGDTMLDAAGARARRPIGAVVVAAIFLFLGIGLAGGGIQRMFQLLTGDGPELKLIFWLKVLHLVTLGVWAVAAGIGLLRGGKTGWWLAVVLAYLLFASFVVLPPFHKGLAGQVGWLAVKAAVCVALVVYICRPKVRAYFQAGTPTWKTHAAVCAACVAAVLAVGVW